MIRHTFYFGCVFLAIFLGPVDSADAQTREEKVRADKEKVVAEGFWIYNDLAGAMSKAKENGKPVLVVLRCIPCEECVKLDDDLVDKDPVIRPLLEEFVCVRQVSTNGLDLDVFQYDTDQSFAIFMLNANGTVYGRFGTRSHRTQWFGDVSLEGLAKALRGALELHADYPRNKAALAGKRGQPLEYRTPELYPSLKEKYTEKLNYEGNVVKSCIHCHQIGDARRESYWSKGEPIPESLFYPFPHPKSVGLILDPNEKATVKSVESDSIAEACGLREGDQIVTFAGQPMLSLADVQWVLHGVDPNGGKVPMKVLRAGAPVEVQFSVDKGWRRSSDISWRVSTWPLRRMVTGGLVLDAMESEAKRDIGLADESMALLVTHVGQYNAHAAGKKAGFKKGDVIVGYDNRSDFTTEADLMRHAIESHKPGDKVDVSVLRMGREQQLRLPIQK